MAKPGVAQAVFTSASHTFFLKGDCELHRDYLMTALLNQIYPHLETVWYVHVPFRNAEVLKGCKIPESHIFAERRIRLLVIRVSNGQVEIGHEGAVLLHKDAGAGTLEEVSC